MEVDASRAPSCPNTEPLNVSMGHPLKRHRTVARMQDYWTDWAEFR